MISKCVFGVYQIVCENVIVCLSCFIVGSSEEAALFIWLLLVVPSSKWYVAAVLFSLKLDNTGFFTDFQVKFKFLTNHGIFQCLQSLIAHRSKPMGGGW